MVDIYGRWTGIKIVEEENKKNRPKYLRKVDEKFPILENILTDQDRQLKTENYQEF